MREDWRPMIDIIRGELDSFEILSGEGYWIRLSELTDEELSWFELNVQRKEYREIGKPVPRRCPHGHLVEGANKGFRKGNGYAYCIACARGKSYCHYHRDMDFEEVAQRYYDKLMEMEEE